MNNLTLLTAARKMLKNMLAKCTEEQQLMFKRMYSHDNLELPIDDVVDNMDANKLDWALSQVERTVNKNKF